MDSVTSAGSYKRLMDEANAAQRAMDSLTSASGYKKLIHEANAAQRAIDSLTSASGYKKLTDAFLDTPAISRAIKEFSDNVDFRKEVESFALAMNSGAILEENLRLDSDQIELIGHQLNELSDAENPSAFTQLFGKLHPYAQLTILFLFLQFMLPIITNVVANLITPHIESVISSATSTKSKRQVIKNIASIKIDNIYLNNHRFVTTDNLILRASPSTKSPMLDRLRLGQVITVLSRNKGWLEVTYSLGEGEVISGWVFARYTAKFQQ